MASIAIRRPSFGSASSWRVGGQALAGVIVAAVAGALTIVVDKEGSLLGVAVLIVVAGSLWLLTTRHTTLALGVLTVYLGAFDGFLKLSTGSTAVSFLRDALIFAIALGVLVRAQISGTQMKTPPLTGWVVAFVVVVVVQMANPQGGSLTHSLAGVRQLVEFVPLFFLAYAFVRTKRALRGFILILVVVATANGLVSLAQFRLTPQQFAAWGPGYAQRVLGTGAFAFGGRAFTDLSTGQKHTRPFGLGSDAGSGGLVGAFAIASVLALASRFARLRYMLFTVAMAIGATLAIVTSQGRGAIVCAVIAILTYGLLSATSSGRFTRLLGIGVGVVIAVVVVQAILGSGGDTANRYGGLSTSGIVNTTDNARGKSITLIPTIIKTFPLGAGLGSAGPASTAPGPGKNADNVDTETAFSFLDVETGIPGLLILTAFPVLLLWLAFRRCRLEPDREASLLLAALVAPVAGILALYLTAGGLIATTPAGPYLWAVAGVVAYWLITRQAELRRAGQLEVAR